MKVFISWSGELSGKVATVFADWIQNVLQSVQPWVSSEDINKGAFWFTDLANQLSETSLGVLVITKQNMCAPWILFEAGALSKGLTKARVCPLLVDFNDYESLPRPLQGFNGATVDKKDMLRLVQSINQSAGETILPEDKVIASFDKWWENFEGKLDEVFKNTRLSPLELKPNPSYQLAEILKVVNAILDNVQRMRVQNLGEALTGKIHMALPIETASGKSHAPGAFIDGLLATMKQIDDRKTREDVLRFDPLLEASRAKSEDGSGIEVKPNPSRRPGAE